MVVDKSEVSNLGSTPALTDPAHTNSNPSAVSNASESAIAPIKFSLPPPTSFLPTFAPSSLLQPLLPPKVPKTSAEAAKSRRLIVVLCGATLEVVRMGSGSSSKGGSKFQKKPGAPPKGDNARYTLLNCDDHQNILRKTGRDIADFRPDIAHQCLLTLLDSPLNKAGLLQVFVHTAGNVLIEINPSVRIPRTYKRFAGLMVQLLHKLSIRSTSSPEKLMKVIRNPVADHLPPGCVKVSLSPDATLTAANHLASDLVASNPESSIAFFIGAFARGPDEFESMAGCAVDRKVSISNYNLSASVTCGKVVGGFEDVWGVI
ncbi:Nep1-domain-containing protein [Gonapodya prolifera JEL478]|uniref:Nep1-domain-containing protein n=1 Tax=Gonapodya prolifera (strain JEL478) TaxID=1344416 RepID=A0A139B082_GONPJ|nr:Nep1-domain-containing protein [Gonapodya prolifera JEL478]|eukprot:KXS22213.1 Nep1-domain-containing protein [Gonapodya prolifera JEL478]